MPQVADHANIERSVLDPRPLLMKTLGGLMHDTEFTPQSRFQLCCREGLQRDQAGGCRERSLSFRGSTNITIEVGSGQGHNNRFAGLIALELKNRIGAAPGMHRDQQIASLARVGLGDRRTMAQFLQNASPSDRSSPVPR